MIYTTGVTVKIGLSATTGQFTNVTNGIKAFIYDEQQGESGEGASPAFTINSTLPMGYNPPHKYVKLTLQTISDLFTPLYTTNGTSPTYGPYINPSGDNVLIPYFVVSAKASDGSTITFTCANVYPGKATMTLDTTGKETVTSYNFVCDSVTPSA
jgi:hypothetical protein